MTVKITAANIRSIASGANSVIVEGIVKHQDLIIAHGIDTPKRVAHFLAHGAVETAGFTRLIENLYYTSTRRLRQVWPSRFKTDAAAAPYVRNPEKLANNVYGGRLGNVKPGDGWRYIGRAVKNTTGLYNYGEVKDETGVDVVDDPELMEQFPVALESACVYWRNRKLNRFADAGDIAGLTKAIQGGSGGLDDRRVYTARALKVKWGVGAPEPAETAMVDGAELPVLRMGMGVSVKDMHLRPIIREAQQMLQAHGFYEEGALDGKFGGGTDVEVRAFQEHHGVMKDGVIGETTWGLLNADPVKPAKDEPEAPDPSKVSAQATLESLVDVNAKKVSPRPPLPEATADVGAAQASPVAPLQDSKERVELVQRLLTEKGYYEGGPADGYGLGRTQGAILAFKNEHGLPLTPDIDDGLIAALEAAPHRYVTPARAGATEKEIMAEETSVSEPIRQSWWQKKIAEGGGVVTVVGGIIYSNLGGALEWLDPLKSFIGNVPSWVWGVLVVIACFVVWASANRTGKAATEMYRKGKVS